MWWLILALFIGFLAGKWTTIKEKIPSKGPHPYFLRSYKAPRMNGNTLFFFSLLFDIPVVSHVLSFILFRRNMFHTLRDVDVSCNPTYLPLIHDFEKDTQIDSDTKLSAEEFLKRELEALSQEGNNKNNKKKIYNEVSDYARAYRSKTVLPTDVALQVIAAIKAGDEQPLPLKYLNQLNTDDVLQQARASDERFKLGEPLSIFDGVPISVKDEFDVKGYATTCGTKVFSAVAISDASVAARLRKMGAILVGKTVMIEIGMGTKGVNPHYGSPRNPYNLNYHTGGSSSGSAAAAASGMFPLTVAADGGGSIRIPASLCGAVGLKPTFGRVSEHGAFPLCWTVAHAGPIASSVRDCALGYAVMAGVDEYDNNTLLQPPVIIPNFSALSSLSPLTGLRVGIYTPWFNHADPEIVKSCRAAVDILKNLGGEIVEVPVLEGFLEYSRLSHTVAILSEMGSAVAAKFDNSTKSQFGLDTKLTLSAVSPLTARDYVLANRIRTLSIEGVKKIFEQVDILVTPTTAAVAPRFNTLDGKEDVDIEIEGLMMRHNFLGNFTGIPGISLPCGYTREGLPIGVQIMGKWWEEHVILKVAHLLEEKIEKLPPSQLITYL